MRAVRCDCGRAGRAGGRAAPGWPLTDEVVCEILAATVTPPPESLQPSAPSSITGTTTPAVYLDQGRRRDPPRHPAPRLKQTRLHTTS
jgi:hypothetical protein